VQTPERIAVAAKARIEGKAATEQREKTIEALRSGNPLDAEESEVRKVQRFKAVAKVDDETAARLAQGESPDTFGLKGEAKTGAERIQGKTDDFVGVSFLDLARKAANAVGRVVFGDLTPVGSGFLISDKLFITNNHVIEDVAAARRLLVEFSYELDAEGKPLEPTRFRFDPETYFFTNGRDDLDFTIVAVGERLVGSRTIKDYGCCPLLATGDKHVVGEFVNIIQHPDGDYKKVVVRENNLVARLGSVLHYFADTSPGSSGSPVFNDQWEVIALHHWGEPHREIEMPDGKPLRKDVNEGIRISAIAAQLDKALQTAPADVRGLFDGVLAEERRETNPPSRPIALEPKVEETTKVRNDITVLGPDGTASWTIPIHVSIRLGEAKPASAPTALVKRERETDDTVGDEAVVIDRKYSNRKGYDPDFLDDHEVPMPKLSTAMKAKTAKLKDPPEDGDEHELKYEHFSLKVNKERRMAWFTASNIDGATWKGIDRKTGDFSEGAEASETWFDDPRIDADAQCNQKDHYDNQKPKRVFDRGHLVRRQDPSWGPKSRARRANNDTFHFTNCTPQELNFNERKKFWQGIETWILEDSAVADGDKVCVFTGPVLDDNDPGYRDIQVPMKFWKVVVFERDGELRSVGLVASQKERIKQTPGGIPESLDDPSPVAEFQVSVADIEQMTGLDFGKVTAADTFGGGESMGAERKLASFEDIRL
jgi:endonuclease G